MPEYTEADNAIERIRAGVAARLDRDWKETQSVETDTWRALEWIDTVIADYREDRTRALVGHGTPGPTKTEPEKWEYGFYDSADETKTIFWYVFGLPHKTPESAERTGDKNVYGQTVIVRRQPGSSDWELHESAPEPTGENEHG